MNKISDKYSFRSMKQHIIPNSYLKAWIDLTSVGTKEPYIWLMSRSAKDERKKKSPKKAFVASNIYTINSDASTPDLTVESEFSQAEGDFVAIREKFIQSRSPLDKRAIDGLIRFAAAMWLRSNLMQRRFLDFLRTTGDLTSVDDDALGNIAGINQFNQNGRPVMIRETLPEVINIFNEMSLSLATTDDELGFVTSDRPCMAFVTDEGAESALDHPNVQLTMPVNPKTLLFMNRKGVSGYLRVDQRFVDEINRRLRFYCDDYYVSAKGEVREYWLKE